MRRVMAKIHFLFYFVCFCAYSWPYPSYLASPVLVNPSKVIFSIINYIQNICCIAICAESTISDNIKNQENVCSTSIQYMFVLHLFSTCMYYIYLLHSFITSIYYMYVLRLFITSMYFFDLAVPAGACRACFLRKYFFQTSRFDTRFRIYANFRLEVHLQLLWRCVVRRATGPQR